jgi:acid phosphatase
MRRPNLSELRVPFLVLTLLATVQPLSMLQAKVRPTPTATLTPTPLPTWTPVAAPTRAPAAAPAPARIPIPDLPEVKRQIREYYRSGQYEAEIAAVTAEAHAYLQTLSFSGADRPAMVLDVDETALSNWPFEDRLDFAYDADKWKAWTNWAAADPLRPTLELVRYARERGVAIFFVTGRSESERKATEQNLREAGYEDWEQIFMKPDGYKGTTVEFKSGARETIEKGGWRIVLNLGDQQSDLDGGHAEKTFRLPNPFYRTP